MTDQNQGGTDRSQARIMRSIEDRARTPSFPLTRLSCADGAEDELQKGVAERNRVLPIDTGAFCMSVIEFSAASERLPNNVPHHSMRAPYLELARDSGFRDGTIQPEEIIRSMQSTLAMPQVARRTTAQPIRLQGPSGAVSSEVTRIYHGTAWDVGAAAVAERARNGERIAPPTRSIAQLVELAGRCFSKVTPQNPTNVTLGECNAGGADHMANFLNRRRLTAPNLAAN